jgi:signal transduction histidine kinase/ligand-binding sensor domain-containing protein/DNA-binding response OmpR family regulator
MIKLFVAIFPAFFFFSSHLCFSSVVYHHILRDTPVFDMVMDENHVLWIATENGLVRYNSKTFTHYRFDPRDSLSLLDNSIRALHFDSQKNLWIGTRNGLNLYNPSLDNFRQFVPDNSTKGQLHGSFIKSISEDSRGFIWVATENNGLNRFDPDTETFDYVKAGHSLKEITSNQIEKISVDNRGGLWVATRKGLNYRDPGTEEWNQYYLSPARDARILKNDLISVESDSQGDLWIFSRDKSISNLRKNGQLSSWSFEHDISTTFRDLKGNIYMGTLSGEIFLLPADNPTVESIRVVVDEGQKLGAIRSVFVDPWANLWMGTEYGLFVKYSTERQFTAIAQTSTGRPLKDVMAMTMDHEQRVWLSAGGSLFIKEGDRWMQPSQVFRSGVPWGNEIVYTLFRDSYNMIWIGTFSSGLYRFNPLNGDVKHYAFNTPSYPEFIGINSVWALAEDHNANLWIGTWGGGLFFYDREKENFTHYHAVPDDEKSLSNNKILSLLIDAQGVVWIGTDGGGLNSYNPDNGSFEHHQFGLSQNMPVVSRSILCLHEDQSGQLWIGSDGGGLFRFNTRTLEFSVYNHLHGLINQSVKNIKEDLQGNLWISTNGAGIFMFIPKDERFIQFTVDDGLSSNRFHNGSGFASPDGLMYFGSNEGYTVFDPAKIKANNFVPNIIVTDVVINNSLRGYNSELFIDQLRKRDALYLKPSAQLITIDFAAVEYSLPGRNYYRYRLRGLNDEWTLLDHHSRVSFMNLPHGRYTLEIQSTNSDGLWVDNVNSVKLIVLPPFYRTRWFGFLLVVLVLGCIWALIHVKTKGLKKRQLFLESEVSRRTEEIKQQAEKLAKQNKILVAQQQELTNRNQKIIDSTERIRIMTKKIHESDMIKMRFFTNISHEIRTPLTLIIGPLDQLLMQFKNLKDHAETMQSLITMRRNAERILRLFDQIITFRKAESGALKLHTRQGNISAFLNDLAGSFQELAAQKHINLSFASEPADINTFFDSEKLEKVISNLLANAIKFTHPNGEVVLGVKALHVTGDQGGLNGKLSGNLLEIMVKDSGIGIPEKDIDNIFDRFYQVGDKGVMSPTEGVGIGLSLVKSLIEVHKGTISVTSAVGKGSTFRILLPMEKLQQDEALLSEQGKVIEDIYNPGTIHQHLILDKAEVARADDEKEIASGKKGSRKTLLVIEDNIELRDYLVNWLQAEYEVLDAENGQQGLEMALDEIPDLVISDVIMPVMDGFEFLKKLKANIEISHIPVILLTAKVNIEDRITGLNLSADAYIDKPFHLQHLSATIHSLLENRKFVQRKYRDMLNMDPTDAEVVSPDEIFLKKTKDIIEKNIANPDFNVNQLSVDVGVSRAGIYRKLKALTNLSVNILIRNMRIKRAAQILSQNKLYVNEVAFMVGFNDVQYFRKCFRKMYHMTPSEYAAKNAGDDPPETEEIDF